MMTKGCMCPLRADVPSRWSLGGGGRATGRHHHAGQAVGFLMQKSSRRERAEAHASNISGAIGAEDWHGDGSAHKSDTRIKYGHPLASRLLRLPGWPARCRQERPCCGRRQSTRLSRQWNILFVIPFLSSSVG